jgi:hypothetical protein
MKKAGFIISIVAVSLAGLFIFFPAGAYFATIIGAPLDALSVDRGVVMGWIAGGLNIANILFFSPSVWIATGLTLSFIVPVFLIAVQVVAMLIMFFWTKHLRGEKTPFFKK